MITGRVTNIRQDSLNTTVTLTAVFDSLDEMQNSMNQEMILISKTKYDKLMHYVTAGMILEE